MRWSGVAVIASGLLGCSGTAGEHDDGVRVVRDAAADVSSIDASEPHVAPEDAPPADTEDGGVDAVEAGEASVDLDEDGLDDAYEAKVAAEYLPFMSVDPDDDCPRAVIVYRLRPHPDAPSTRLLLVVDTLFEKDCGAAGHPGDNEVFGVTIDPSKPAPAGILAVRAISHQSTACEEKTTCGSCGGLDACTTAAKGGVAGYPVVFYSKGKHGAYASEGKCDGACFLTNWCTLAKEPFTAPMVNAGEPDRPLVNDLTKAGFVTVANGWSEKDVFDYDVWSGEDFGGAGNVADDLVDPAFVTPACP